jgi:hypothetical protein
MLPNDPMLALRAAQDSMAHRQYESSQERLAATVRLGATPNSALPDRNPTRGFQVLVHRLRAWLEGHRPGRHAAADKRETAIT